MAMGMGVGVGITSYNLVLAANVLNITDVCLSDGSLEFCNTTLFDLTMQAY